jgi:hypothetical protein
MVIIMATIITVIITRVIMTVITMAMIMVTVTAIARVYLKQTLVEAIQSVQT